MYDRFNRHINYLRISVTDKCNLRCTYCMPEEGVELLRHEDILSYEEIVEVVRYAVSQGIYKVRLTGGEPLVRRNIKELIRMIANVEGVTDLSMTTNGIMLKDYAIQIAKAGLKRVNVSLDTLNPEKYKEITRGGDVNKVTEGLNEASLAGLNPVKVNMVISEYTNQDDKEELKDFCEKNNYQLRFIKKMDLKTGKFSIVEGGLGGDCPRCNRLRVTSNGLIKPCLFSEHSYSIRELGIEDAFRRAVQNKPKAGKSNATCTFYRLGG